MTVCNPKDFTNAVDVLKKKFDGSDGTEKTDGYKNGCRNEKR